MIYRLIKYIWFCNTKKGLILALKGIPLILIVTRRGQTNTKTDGHCDKYTELTEVRIQ